MESNNPVVGGEVPEQDVPKTAETHPADNAEQSSGDISGAVPASSQTATELTSDTGVHPDAQANHEHSSDVESDSSSATTIQESVESQTAATTGNAKGADVNNLPENAMQALLDQSSDEPQVKKGDIIEGTIAQTTPTEILVDIGLKSEGIISGKELERMDRETLERLKIGEKVLAYVLIPEDRNGNVVLSLNRALEEQDWRQAEVLQQSGELFDGKVDGYNKGGLIVRFGRVRGFVPESQVSRDRRRRTEGSDPQEKWSSMRGEDITLKVLEVDRARNRLILSEREAAPAMREVQKEKLIDELQVGDVKTGRVKSLADFGAFVDVGGADGLVHLTEMSWKHITHPKDVLKVGQQVEVEVISIDRERRRIGLSIKRREEDPWMVIARQYAIGQLVEGTITKLTKFGAFARLVDNPEIEGLIHISELAGQRVNHPKEVVNEGETLTLRIVKIEPQERRMGLSLKKVSSAEFVETDFRRATTPPEAQAPAIGDYVDYEAATLKDEERRRNDRRKGNKKGKKGKDFEDFDDDSEY
jgi:small subunit ribosomal protein S1